MVHTSNSHTQDALDHGLASKAVPSSHVEDACLVYGQVAHQREPVDSAVAIHRHCVDKGGEAETVSQCEGDDACAGKKGLSSDMHNRHLQTSDKV